MEDKAFKKVYSLIKNKLQEQMMVSGAPTNSTNPPGQTNIAGLPPDNPPVDLRKGKSRKWNPFFKDLVKVQRRKNK